MKKDIDKAVQTVLEASACLVRLRKEDSLLKDHVAEMLRYDVESLEELEEIERLEAEAAERAKNSLLAPDPYGFLLDVDFPSDLQTLAPLGAPQAS